MLRASESPVRLVKMQIAGLLITEKAVSALCHKNSQTHETGAGAKGEGFI